MYLISFLTDTYLLRTEIFIHEIILVFIIFISINKPKLILSILQNVRSPVQCVVQEEDKHFHSNALLFKKRIKIKSLYFKKELNLLQKLFIF